MLASLNLNTQKPFALFDIDGALVKPYVIEHFATFLVHSVPQAFDKSAHEEMRKIAYNFRENRTLLYRDFATLWVQTYAAGISGQAVSEIMILAKKFWANNSDLLYPYTRGLLDLLKPHCTAIAISGSPFEALYPLLIGQLGFDHVFASEIGVNTVGRYTGVVLHNRATYEAKMDVISILKQEISNPNIWDKSFGFGDNITHDLPLLKYVGSPYLFVDFSTKEKQREFTSLFPELRRAVPAIQVLRQPQDNKYVYYFLGNRLAIMGFDT